MPLTLKLRNHTTSSRVFAYVTGIDSASNRPFILRADGHTLYFPSSPSSTGAHLAVDCAIVLPGPQNGRPVTVPSYFAGGRIWFSVGEPLTFLLNPGPGGSAAIVEPSVLNPADPNIHKVWGFCELSWNQTELYANISAVDFFCLPIALTLYYASGGTSHVSGTNQNGLQSIANGLLAQHGRDGANWDHLIERNGSGGLLRVLSPNTAISRNPSLFPVYFNNYVNEVWNKYEHQNLTIDTQSSAGAVSGRVINGRLTFNNLSLSKPSTHDIFGNSTGPFQVQGSGLDAAVVPRLAAAFNRSTLLAHTNQPNGAPITSFYTNGTTNHYARQVHQASLDRTGYAFPYDDVTASGAKNVSGKVEGQPKCLIVAVGGHGAGLGPAPYLL